MRRPQEPPHFREQFVQPPFIDLGLFFYNKLDIFLSSFVLDLLSYKCLQRTESLANFYQA
jgi:hypothetical protein